MDLSHHQSIAFFKGRFYAIWSNGRQDEDAPRRKSCLRNFAIRGNDWMDTPSEQPDSEMKKRLIVKNARVAGTIAAGTPV
ncbi:MAG: hypothetical protein N2689_11165 [Verrucomicrobiae bacterium]|nr:hypothetical protein [Verrucomicrobiae bacterium]